MRNREQQQNLSLKDLLLKGIVATGLVSGAIYCITEFTDATAAADGPRASLNDTPLTLKFSYKQTKTEPTILTVKPGEVLCEGEKPASAAGDSLESTGPMVITCANGPLEAVLEKEDVAWIMSGKLNQDGESVITAKGGDTVFIDGGDTCARVGVLQMDSYGEEEKNRILNAVTGDVIAELPGDPISKNDDHPAYNTHLVTTDGAQLMFKAGNGSAVIPFCVETAGTVPTDPTPITTETPAPTPLPTTTPEIVVSPTPVEEEVPPNCVYVFFKNDAYQNGRLNWTVENHCPVKWTMYEQRVTLQPHSFSNSGCLVDSSNWVFACPLPEVGEQETVSAAIEGCGLLSWYGYTWDEAAHVRKEYLLREFSIPCEPFKGNNDRFVPFVQNQPN